MNKQQSQAWWHYGHVWLMISGPLLVVIASLVTAYIAFNSQDPVIDDYYRKGIEINKTLTGKDAALLPAIQARNRAATITRP